MVFLKIFFAILLVLFLVTDVLFPALRFFMRKNKVTPVALIRDDSARTVDV
jgi:hypothetical protein